MIRHLAILILLSDVSIGQVNLVPNGSFEELTECPWMTHQIQFASPWTNTHACSPDIFNVCFVPNPYPPYNVSGGIPQNAIGHQYAHSGDGYAGIFTFGGPYETNGRDYLQVELTEPIRAESVYVVSFWVSLADDVEYAISSIGTYFSDTFIIRSSYNAVLEVSPSVQSPEGFIMSDKDIWYHITDTFMSRYGGERYLLIGNFKSTEESDTLFLADNPIVVPTEHGWDTVYQRLQSYYYIDDVSVVALDSIPEGIGDAQVLEFSVFPNPAKDVLKVNLGDSFSRSSLGMTAAQLRLMDVSGRQCAQFPLEKGVAAGRGIYSAELDISSLPPGLYLLQIQDGQGRTGTQRVAVY